MAIVYAIIKDLANTIAPQIVQFFKSPAFPQLLTAIQRIPPPVYGYVGKVASEEMRKLPERTVQWYASLKPEDRERLNNAIAWVLKDIASGSLEDLIGLPVGKLVNPAVDKVLAHLGHINPSKEESNYIRSELERQLWPESSIGFIQRFSNHQGV